MILAMICISLFGSIVWGHHIYTVGLEIESKIYYTNVTLIISLPTGTKIYIPHDRIIINNMDKRISSVILEVNKIDQENKYN